MLPAAAGSLFGAHVNALDVASGTLALARTYDLRSARGYEGDPPSIDVLEVGAVGGAARVLRRLPARPSALALDPAASRVVVALPDRLVVHATADGALLLEAALPDVRGLAVAADGTIAASIDGGVVLLAPGGTERARHALGGTASDVMRIYTGEYGPTYHETRPIDVPAQPVAMAFAGDGRLAVSTTDGAVHVIDGATARRLAPAPDPGGIMEDYPWIVTGLDVGWRGGDVLALTGSGALLRFDVAADAVRTEDDGRCTPSEIEVMLDDFPGDRSERTLLHYCQRAGAALFSPSARRLVHHGSSGIRLRAARTGAGEGAFETLDAGPMAFDGEDRLVMTNAEGLVRVHALPRGRIAAEEPRRGVAGTVSVVPARDFVLVSVNPSLPGESNDELGAWTSRAFHLDGTPRAGFDLTGVSVAVAEDVDRAVVVDHEPFRVRLVDLDGRLVRDFGAPGAAAEYHAVAVAPDGRSLVLSRDGVVRVLGEDGADRELVAGSGVVTRLALAAAGRRLLVVRFFGETFTYRADVLEVSSGRVLFTTATGQNVALSPDGARVALVAGPGGDLVVVAVDGGAEVARLPAGDGALPARSLAFAPDGALYVSWPLSGLARWSPPAAPAPVALGVLGPDALRFSGDAVVVEDQHFGAHVLRASDGAHLASVHALVTGGFVVVAASGAFDGSADARDAFFSVVGDTITRGLDDATAARFRVPGALGRALRGEDVPVP